MLYAIDVGCDSVQYIEAVRIAQFYRLLADSLEDKRERVWPASQLGWARMPNDPFVWVTKLAFPGLLLAYDRNYLLLVGQALVASWRRSGKERLGMG